MSKILMSLVVIGFVAQVQAGQKRKVAQMHDGVQGTCQEAAQAAVDAISKINSPNDRSPALVLKGEPSQVENYTSGGKRPAYKVQTVAGKADGQCLVEKVSYNPEP
jgi:hypothetical protein